MNKIEMFFNVEINYWWNYDDSEYNVKYVVCARSYSEAIDKVEKAYDSSRYDIISVGAKVIEDTEDGIWEVGCNKKGESV